MKVCSASREFFRVDCLSVEQHVVGKETGGLQVEAE